MAETVMKDRRFTIVEQAGYVGETDVTSFPTLREAFAYIDRQYSDEERDQFHPDCLHVDIRQDWTDEDARSEANTSTRGRTGPFLLPETSR